jgi:hypothetical protein
MGDLQCPARVFVAAPNGRLAAPELTDRLRAERVSAVYAAPGTDAERVGPAVAKALGAGWSPQPRLAESPAEVFGDIADRHRGEAVLVLADPGVLAAVTGSARAATGPLTALEADGDGWRMVSPPPLPASGHEVR